jgi:hypothetical protein
MHSDTTAKRVPKVSAKAKAALEETASKKRQADFNGDSVRIQPKKVKSNPPTGSAARTAPKNIAVSRSSPAPSQQAVVHTEDEEEYLRSDNAKNDDVELVVTENEDESAADELSMFKNLGNDINFIKTQQNDS